MRLHVLNQSPDASDVLQSCLRLMAGGDCLLLLEDAVYAACEPRAGALLQALQATPGDSGCRLYVLEADAAARGVLPRLAPVAERIDYAGFVALAVECDSVQSWY